MPLSSCRGIKILFSDVERKRMEISLQKRFDILYISIYIINFLFYLLYGLPGKQDQ